MGFWWADDDMSYSVVGETGRDVLRSVAGVAYDQLL
jgi:hypothetical protein